MRCVQRVALQVVHDFAGAQADSCRERIDRFGGKEDEAAPRDLHFHRVAGGPQSCERRQVTYRRTAGSKAVLKWIR